jgi:hypothetical protein
MNIDKLSRVADSTLPKQQISDAAVKVARFKRIKDELEDDLSNTETTEEAVDVALEKLENEDPEEVVKALVEVLAEKFDELAAEEEAIETPAEEAMETPAEEAEKTEEEKVSDARKERVSKIRARKAQAIADAKLTK